MAVDCAISVREQVGDQPTYRYTQLSLRSPEGNGMRRIEYPPGVGDFVYLYSENPQASGAFVIVSRTWEWSAEEAVESPPAGDGSNLPSRLVLIVEPADGPFSNEAPVDRGHERSRRT